MPTTKASPVNTAVRPAASGTTLAVEVVADAGLVAAEEEEAVAECAAEVEGSEVEEEAVAEEEAAVEVMAEEEAVVEEEVEAEEVMEVEAEAVTMAEVEEEVEDLEDTIEVVMEAAETGMTDMAEEDLVAIW